MKTTADDSQPKRPYHAPTIRHIGLISEVTEASSTTGAADDSNYGPNTTGS
jgi:hypothetical protein